MIDQPTAENNLAKNEKFSSLVKGISSKILTAENEQIISFASFYQPTEYFTKLNLKEFMQSQFSRESEKFREDFVGALLTQCLFENTDQSYMTNFHVIECQDLSGERIRRIAPNLDYACCRLFLENLGRYKKAFKKGISAENMCYLKGHYKNPTDKFFESLKVIKGDEFEKLCDFSGLEDYYGESESMTKKLKHLGRFVRSGYRDRASLFDSCYSTAVLLTPSLVRPL